MARKTQIERVAEAIGGTVDRHNDGSGSWVLIENHDYSISICFDGKGNKFEGIVVAHKIWQVVDEKVIARIP